MILKKGGNQQQKPSPSPKTRPPETPVRHRAPEVGSAEWIERLQEEEIERFQEEQIEAYNNPDEDDEENEPGVYCESGEEPDEMEGYYDDGEQDYDDDEKCEDPEDDDEDETNRAP